jgi:hypothetical protein
VVLLQRRQTRRELSFAAGGSSYRAPDEDWFRSISALRSAPMLVHPAYPLEVDHAEHVAIAEFAVNFGEAEDLPERTARSPLANVNAGAT